MNMLYSILFVLFSIPAMAQTMPPEVKNSLGDAKLKGTATAKLFLKEIYEAELWQQGDTPFSYNRRFALSLTYKTGFRASVLAWATAHEIARMEGVKKNKFDALEEELQTCFSNVRRGDRFTGLAKSPDHVVYYLNGRKTCDFRYPRFTERFFGIWLGKNTRDPMVTASLIGQN